jgi:S-DNA-T family DNA segregation ATPase FtsK/SpoIIIE
MTSLTVRRPARMPVPDPGSGPIELTAPPQMPEAAPLTGSMGMILVPAASGAGAVLLALTQQDRPLLAAAGLLVLAASIAVGAMMVIGTRTGSRRRLRTGRERYLDYLELLRGNALGARDRQLQRARMLHPDPADTPGLAHLPARRWERRRGDPDFLLVRFGLGTVPLARPVVVRFAVHDPLVSYDQVCLDAAADLARQYAMLDEQPVCLSLAGTGAMSVIGDGPPVRALARAVIGQVAAAHSPADVAVLVWTNGDPQDWEWTKWLPHALSSAVPDGPLPARLLATDPVEAAALVHAEFGPEKVPAVQGGARKLIAIVDRLDRNGAAAHRADDLRSLTTALRTAGAHQIHLLAEQSDEGEEIGLRVLFDRGSDSRHPDKVQVIRSTGSGPSAGTASDCRLDLLDEVAMAALARALAPLRPAEDEAPAEPAGSPGTGALLPIGDPAGLDPAHSWRRRSGDLLCAPIGVDVDGVAVVLDLKEAARGGMGPHGLIVGATGSGKSELLRTLVLALAIRHPPASVALLLVDFKGGATFSGLSTLPHLAGMITNLQDDDHLVDRFRQALGGELLRRQHLLAAAGNLSSLQEYTDQGGGWEPLPHLLVIVDEFSELLAARPEIADLFVTVGRIGRSIGIHLLLATQRLDTGRLRGLESHLSYRICLRTFSEPESREAIGTPDAYHLGTEPGGAYLRTDGPGLRRFRVAMVSRPRLPAPAGADTRTTPTATVLPYLAVNGLAARVQALEAAGGDVAASGVGRGGDVGTLLTIAVQRLVAGAAALPHGRPARRIWLDPLPVRLAWSGIPEIGPAGDARISAAFGVVDLPERQQQQPLTWDCTGGNAHLLVVGAGRSGKSTTVRALLVALCRRHPPGALAVYGVDFGGETLLPLRTLPQVAAVATRSQPDLTRKVFARLGEMLDERESLIRRERLGGLPQLRAARIGGLVDPAVPGDVVVVVDGWSALRDTDPEVEPVLEQLLTRGSGLGVHVVLTVNGPGQLRTRLLAGFGRRIELRLADAFDSAIDRRLAGGLPTDLPGRALVAGGHFAQIVVPESGATAAATEQSAGEISDQVRRRWPQPAVPRVRTLPSSIGLDELAALAPSGLDGAVIIGLGDKDLAPLQWDHSGRDPHLLVYGDSGSGKTSLLRAVLAQLLSSRDRPSQRAAAVHVIDHRRELSSTLDAAGIATADTATADGGHAVTSTGAAALCAAVAAELACRLTALDHPGVRDLPRSGPEIFLVVDDYEMVSGAMAPAGNPLLPLVPYLARAGDLGFHLLLTRRTGGAARAQYEPVLQALSDLGGPVLLFSGPAAEGRLGHGTASAVLPVGRARLVTRDAPPQLVQTPWVPPVPER